MAEEDILYGKTRHLFGGIEPSNMLKFKAAISTDADIGIILEAQLPNDTVVDGQTLCSVAGAVIRRKSTAYPINEFDGELVADIHQSTILTDFVHDTMATYYYSAFPYTTQGVYNRNAANRTSVNSPKGMVSFSGKCVYDYESDTSTIYLSAVLPEGVESVSIRKSTRAYPMSENEGIEFMSITEDGIYTDSNVSIGLTYYYTAFLYPGTTVGIRDDTSFISVPCVRHNYLFGFDIDLDDPDPNTRVTYPYGVDNHKYAPAAMNTDTEKFSYGDWDIAPGEKFMPRPCMLNYDGTVAHYLDPGDYSKREDGVTPSKVNDVDFEGNAMMEWPKIYTHREEVDGVYMFRCSDMKLGADWDCWCNYDINDHEIDHFYTSIYTACCPNEDATGGTRLRSISGQTTYSAEYYNTTRNKALHRTNSGIIAYHSWDIGLLADHLLIQDLLVLMGKSTDCSSVYGNGAEAGTTYRSEKSGYMDTKGLFGISKGKSGDKKDGVKVFGMEHYWGNDWRHLAGWVIYNGKQYLKITKGAHDGVGDTSDSFTTKFGRFDSGYNNKKLTVSTTFATTSGYMGSTVTTPYGRLPINANGSISTYECDVISWSNSDTKVGMVGGSCNSATNAAGPFAVQTYNTNTSTSYQTTTLSCKPLRG